MAQKTWSDLSEGQRNAIKVMAVAELALKVAMLVDIRRRPASQIRGPKAAWRLAAAVNLIGPLSYFAFGRRRGIAGGRSTGRAGRS
jgi:Phospholipase_D-nuclease N-terminal